MTKLLTVVSCLLLAAACSSGSAPSPGSTTIPQPAGTAPSSPTPDRSTQTPVPDDVDQGGAPRAPQTSVTLTPAYRFDGSIKITLVDDSHEAVVELVVTDEAGHPAANVQISGSFTGGIHTTTTMTTDERGIATGQGIGPAQHMMVGFTVNSVSYPKDGVLVPGEIKMGFIYPAPCCPLKTPPTK